MEMAWKIRQGIARRMGLFRELWLDFLASKFARIGFANQ
jgi:hypothetical protein